MINDHGRLSTIYFSMYYYKIKIQYEGSNYAGFQWQNGVKSIQDEINSVLNKLINEKVTTVGASRTDTGVHAFDQIVKVTSELEIDQTSFLNEFNSLVSRDIRCLEIQASQGDFRPSASASKKEYRYLFTNNTIPIEGHRQFVSNISNPLNINNIKFCLEALKGVHDFCNFYSSGSNVKSTIRDILFCELTEINPHDLFSSSQLFNLPDDLTHCFQIKIVASGFLKQMIRHIVSALWMVGSGKMSIEDFLTLLKGPKSQKQHWKVAPPNGLLLYKISY